MDLTEAEDIKKRWQEYTEELYKKDLHDTNDHDVVITHLEPDMLECEIKWALGSITTNKANRGDGIPVEVFQILKHDAVKVLHSICQQIWKTEQWPQAFATRMEDWTCLGQHKRQREFPVVTRESRRNSRKTTWLPRHRKMKPFPATAPQEKSHVRNWSS